LKPDTARPDGFDVLMEFPYVDGRIDVRNVEGVFAMTCANREK
jgi:hypothetical protein